MTTDKRYAITAGAGDFFSCRGWPLISWIDFLGPLCVSKFNVDCFHEPLLYRKLLALLYWTLADKTHPGLSCRSPVQNGVIERHHIPPSLCPRESLSAMDRVGRMSRFARISVSPTGIGGETCDLHVIVIGRAPLQVSDSRISSYDDAKSRRVGTFLSRKGTLFKRNGMRQAMVPYGPRLCLGPWVWVFSLNTSTVSVT